MALIFNKIMNEQQTTQAKHAKILQVYRSKNFKKQAKNPYSQLYFKLKAHQSTELIVSYQDLKNNFPFALIEYYEQRMKVSRADEENEETCDIKEMTNKLNINSKYIETKASKITKKQPQKQGKVEKQQRIVLENDLDDMDKNAQAIYDYDQYIKEKEHSYKTFYALFSQNQWIENRYLKDLKGEGGHGRRSGREEVIEGKRKRQKIEYDEE